MSLGPLPRTQDASFYVRVAYMNVVRDSPDGPPANLEPTSRPWIRIVGLCALALLCMWIAFVVTSVVLSATQSALAAPKLASGAVAIKAKDTSAAKVDFQEAAVHLATSNAAISNPGLKPLELVPFVGALYKTVVLGSDASVHAAIAATAASDLAGEWEGSNGKPAVFSAGQVNLATLSQMGGPLQVVNAEVNAISGNLAAVPNLPGLSALKSKATEQLDPAQAQLNAVTQMWPAIPDALGANGPKRYLVAGLNSAELLPTGGAPLSITVVRVDKGKIEVLASGQTSSDFFDVSGGNVPWLTWDHVKDNPVYGPSGKSVFVNSNLHPDFQVSGEEMARAWQAATGERINGVVALDTQAVASILAATGPLPVANEAPVTSENIAQRLLIDAYKGGGADLKQRHETNNKIMASLVTRAQSPAYLPKVARALIGLAPERHFQVNMRDPDLQGPLNSIDLTGALSDQVPDSDTFGVFTASSPNKVAVYQKRAIDRQVQVNADGGASVTETIALLNDAPTIKGYTLTGTGYTDHLAINRVQVYVPASAQKATLTVSNPDRKDRAQTGDLADIGGRRYLTGLSRAEPGQTSTVTVTYSLPAGTFSDPDGAVVYRVSMDPQPMWEAPTLTVTVKGPDGATVEGIPSQSAPDSNCSAEHVFVQPSSCRFP